MARKQKTISEQLRDAIESSGITRYRISKDTGIGQSTLTRFMSGERGLPMKAIDKLGAYLNLQLIPNRKGRK